MVEVATYADRDTVSNLANELLANPEGGNDAISQLINRAIKHAQTKINGKLRKAKIQIPEIPVDIETIDEEDPILNLLEAGDLYASAFVIDTKYSEADNQSPTSRVYRTDADEAVDAYIEIIREGYNQDDPENPMDVKIPIGSLVPRW